MKTVPRLETILLYFYLEWSRVEKSFPRSDKRPWLGFLVLHISRSEGLKYCCVAKQIENIGFLTGFW